MGKKKDYLLYVQGLGEAVFMKKKGYTVPVYEIIDAEGKRLFTTDVARGERVVRKLNVYPLNPEVRKELGLKKLKKVV